MTTTSRSLTAIFALALTLSWASFSCAFLLPGPLARASLVQANAASKSYTDVNVSFENLESKLLQQETDINEGKGFKKKREQKANRNSVSDNSEETDKKTSRRAAKEKKDTSLREYDFGLEDGEKRKRSTRRENNKSSQVEATSTAPTASQSRERPNKKAPVEVKDLKSNENDRKAKQKPARTSKKEPEPSLSTNTRTKNSKPSSPPAIPVHDKKNQLRSIVPPTTPAAVNALIAGGPGTGVAVAGAAAGLSLVLFRNVLVQSKASREQKQQKQQKQKLPPPTKQKVKQVLVKKAESKKKSVPPKKVAPVPNRSRVPRNTDVSRAKSGFKFDMAGIKNLPPVALAGAGLVLAALLSSGAASPKKAAISNAPLSQTPTEIVVISSKQSDPKAPSTKPNTRAKKESKATQQPLKLEEVTTPTEVKPIEVPTLLAPKPDEIISEQPQVIVEPKPTVLITQVPPEQKQVTVAKKAAPVPAIVKEKKVSQPSEQRTKVTPAAVAPKQVQPFSSRGDRPDGAATALVLLGVGAIAASFGAPAALSIEETKAEDASTTKAKKTSKAKRTSKAKDKED